MELTVRVQALLTELQLIDGILDRDQDGADLVKFKVVDDSLQFTARGKSLKLRTSCPVAVVSSGAVKIPIRRLLSYLQLFPGDAELRIVASTTDRVEISLVKAKARVPALALESIEIRTDSELPGIDPDALKMEPFPETGHELPASVLLEALQRTLISVADAQSHYTIEGAQLVIQRGRMGMVSTDGHRLSLYTKEVSVGDVPEDVQCLVSRKAMLELIQILQPSVDSGDEPAPVEFALDEARLYFRTPRRYLISNVLDGRFPDYNRVMPSDFTTRLDLEKELMAPVLDRVFLFAEQSGSGVSFDIADGEIKLQVQVFGDAAHKHEESVSVNYSGDPLRIGFNIRYIREFLQICRSKTFRLSIGDPRSAALIELPDTPPDTDYRYVLMPIRV